MNYISKLFDKLQKIQQNGDFFEEGKICFKICVFLRASGNLIESSKFAFSALQLAEESGCLSLCITSCEELVRIFAFLNYPSLSQFYFNKIQYYFNSIAGKQDQIISFSYLMDVLNYFRILGFNCLFFQFIELVNSFLSSFTSIYNQITESSIEKAFFLKFLQILGNFRNLDDTNSEMISNLLRELPKNDKLLYYSFFINGYYHKEIRDYQNALIFFERQLKIAKELRDFHLILFSYFDLMECHFFLGDFSLYQTTFLIIKDLIKGKKEFECILLKGRFFDKIIKSLNVSMKSVAVNSEIDEAGFLISFFNLMRNDSHSMDKKREKMEMLHLCQILTKNEYFVWAFELFLNILLYRTPKIFEFGFNISGLSSFEFSNPFILRVLFWSIKNKSKIFLIDESIRLKLINLQNTQNLLILNELINIFNSSKLGDGNKLFEHFCTLFSAKSKNPLNGFDYFASRRPSRRLNNMVNNFNMKCKTQNSSSGLTIPTINLPSPTFFVTDEFIDNQEIDLSKSLDSCSIQEAMPEIPLFPFLKNRLRTLDLCCSQVNSLPSFIELKNLSILVIGGLDSSLSISSSSLEELIIIFCKIKKCLLSDCYNLKSVSCYFSHIEIMEGTNIRDVNLSLISSESEINQKFPNKRLKINSSI
jgi:tetratricopeptide (TPR) repeat protein